jgi:PAS domain S-box-containing protein
VNETTISPRLEAALELANALDEAVLVVDGERALLAASRRAAAELGPPLAAAERLDDLFEIGEPEFRTWRRSADPLPFGLPGREGRTWFGRACRWLLPETPAAGVLLRLQITSPVPERFASLARKVQELSTEIERRAVIQRELESSERFRRTIVDSALDGIVTIDAEGEILEFNVAAERIFGYTRDEAVGQHLDELVIPAELRDRHRAGLRRYMTTREAVVCGKRIEIAAVRADGSTIDVELAVAPIAIEGTIVFTGHVRDVTERRRNDAARAEQLRLASLGRDVGLALARPLALAEMLQECAAACVNRLDAAFARVWLRDGDVLHLVASAGMYTRLDGTHARIPVGKFAIGIIAETGRPLLTNEVVGDQRIHDQEWAVREDMVGFAGLPLVVDDRVVGVLGLFSRREISPGAQAMLATVANAMALGIERKQIETALQGQTERLARANQSKDEFLAMLAHELRNPLAPVRTGLDLLEFEYGSSDTLRTMKDQLQHLVRLVDDLLDVSRIMRGRIELRREPINLAGVLDRAVAATGTLVEERKHVLAVERLPEAWVDGDRDRLTQVFVNLLNNAAKYTPERGRLQLTCSAAGSRARVSVRDNGIGIDGEFLDEVFDLFAQADRSLDRSQGGLGIGLTLVHRIVELHDGTIRVHSDGAGRGSEFVVEIPLVPRPVSVTSADDLDPRSLANLRILVVDDSVGSARMQRRLLEAIGQTNVALAHDGLAALDVAREFAPDVVFLDIGLPKIDGFEVARRVRADAALQRTHLVALTGYGTAEDRAKGADAGFDEYLVKPVSLADLVRVLAHVEPTSSALSENPS